MTWIAADIPDITLTPTRYNALAPAIVYVSHDVTIPFNSMMSHYIIKNRTASASEWDRIRFETYRSVLEHISIS